MKCPRCSHWIPKGWCLTCGDVEQTEARLLRMKQPLERLPEAVTPIATRRDLALALQGELL